MKAKANYNSELKYKTLSKGNIGKINKAFSCLGTLSNNSPKEQIYL